MTQPTDSPSSLPPQHSATTKASTAPTPAVDQTFYTWSTFFSILAGTATDATRTSYLETRDILNEKADCKKCEENKTWLFKNSPLIRFLSSEIAALGPADGSAAISPKKVQCRRCPPAGGQGRGQGGGFNSEYGIMLCANHLRSRSRVEDTLAHEMVHAYDHLRYKLDPYDLRHAACMEIRAMALSGECRFVREFFGRGQWKITMGMQDCVRRRAALSVAARPACKDDVQAVRIVNEVWDSCFRDTRPFDEVYR